MPGTTVFLIEGEGEGEGESGGSIKNSLLCTAGRELGYSRLSFETDDRNLGDDPCAASRSARALRLAAAAAERGGLDEAGRHAP